jgi:hypothetical protein
VTDPLKPLKQLPGVPRRFTRAASDPPAPDSLPPDTTRDPPVVTIRSRGGMVKVALTSSVISALVGFGGSMMAQPHVDVSRMERKLDQLDSKFGTLDDKVTDGFQAIGKRQTEDSDRYANAIYDTKLVNVAQTSEIARVGDQYMELARRIELVERR